MPTRAHKFPHPSQWGREGQGLPSEVVVLHVESPLRRAALVVVVKRHGLLFVQHAELYQPVEQQVVQHVIDIELVGLPALHRLESGVLHGQLLQVAGDGARAAEAVVWILLEGLLPEEVHLLQHLTDAKIDGGQVLHDIGVFVF